MKSAAADFHEKTMALLRDLGEQQKKNVDAAAEICAQRIARGGLIFLFGSGHSRMMCEEMTPRQGGFVGFFALVEHALSNHAAIVGAKLMMFLVDFSYYRDHPGEIFSLSSLQAGGIFYGGLIAALAVSWWYMRKTHLPLLKTADVFENALSDV